MAYHPRRLRRVKHVTLRHGAYLNWCFNMEWEEPYNYLCEAWERVTFGGLKV